MFDCAVSFMMISIYIFFARTEQDFFLVLLSMSTHMDTALSKVVQVRINSHPILHVSFSALSLDCLKPDRREPMGYTHPSAVAILT